MNLLALFSQWSASAWSWKYLNFSKIFTSLVWNLVHCLKNTPGQAHQNAHRNTACPTRYRTRHSFNNFTTKEDIATTDTHYRHTLQTRTADTLQTRTTDTHCRHTLQTHTADTLYNTLQTHTTDTHYRHTLQTHTTDTADTHYNTHYRHTA
jgi:hypothetical protein